MNAAGKRQNEVDDSADEFDLDGFEVVDLSSCMNFPPGTSLDAEARPLPPAGLPLPLPEHSRWRQGHTNKTGANGIFGCHELEIYPSDRLTCARRQRDDRARHERRLRRQRHAHATSRDDKPRGTPLPCRVRDSSVAPGLRHRGEGHRLRGRQGRPGPRTWPSPSGSPPARPRWRASTGSAAPSTRAASATEGGAAPDFDSTQDIDFDHEAELTPLRQATCSPPTSAAAASPLRAPPAARPWTTRPATAASTPTGPSALLNRAPDQRRRRVHARTRTNPSGGKAIYRAPIRTQPQASLCTAHVFQQIPGQNRIFMGWYSQGTQVLDYEERADGRFEWQRGRLLHPRAGQRVGLARLQGAAQLRRHLHLLGRHRRLRRSAARAATPSTSARSRCRRRRRPRRCRAASAAASTRAAASRAARATTRTRIGPARIGRSGKTFKRTLPRRAAARAA